MTILPILALVAVALFVVPLMYAVLVRLRRIEAYLGIEAQAMQADREISRQRRVHVHQARPLEQAPEQTWTANCSCGWSSPGHLLGESALDALEEHKASMSQQRRAG